jgi:signal transduction histidine kinase/CheY-like chemotaxis protein/HPt (histidine-containing phosphotransfer) domain-containing protein
LNSPSIQNDKNYRLRYAIFGVIAGILFPVAGTLIDCSLKYGFFSPEHFLECQQNNPLLWIIDTAPFFLGLLAAFAGIQMDRVRQKNIELNEKYIQMNILRQMADTANKTKGDFLANMSHEIRTPLSAIIGYNTLLKQTSLGPEQHAFVETIEIATRNLNVIINDILDSSRLDANMLSLEQKPFSLEKLVQNVIQLCRDRAVSKGLNLLLQFDNSIPGILLGDETRLSQILINLIGNSIKFTEKGDVELLVHNLDQQADSVKLRFIVKDSGIGIKKENLSRIFDRFAQENTEKNRFYGGTGLGLHIVRSLVHLHKGELKVKSQPGHGTEFSFEISLPFGAYKSSLPEAQEIGKQELKKSASLSGLKILLAEDNEFNAFLAETYLKRNGAEVEKAENGKKAFEKAKASHFDAIIMDIQMPVLDGKEATRKIRETDNSTPVIACSAHALQSEKEECLSLGMNSYIVKPFEEIELIRAILQFAKKGNTSNQHPMENSEKTGDNLHEIFTKIRQDVGPDFVSIIVQKFREDVPILIRELDELMIGPDLKTIQEKTHKLAGTMATFRFPQGLRLARLAEYAARDGKQEETALELKILKAYLNHTLKQMENYSKNSEN